MIIAVDEAAAARMAAAHLTPARCVGHSTVLTHVHNVYQKIGVGHLPGGVSRVRAALWLHGLWVPA